MYGGVGGGGDGGEDPVRTPMRALLEGAYLTEHYDALVHTHGLEACDLPHVTEQDLLHAGVAKVFHRKRFLRLAADAATPVAGPPPRGGVRRANAARGQSRRRRKEAPSINGERGRRRGAARVVRAPPAVGSARLRRSEGPTLARGAAAAWWRETRE